MPSSSRTGKQRANLALAFLAALAVDAAVAYPDASPWGASNPHNDETCSTCHYDYDAVHDSAAIRIAGLPQTATPSEIYELGVRMTGIDANVGGFQLVATAGEFKSGDETLESTGTAIRSTKTAVIDGDVAWTLSWRAPERASEAIELFLAVSAANDDQSPFGDTIHYRRFVIRLAPRR